MTTQYGTLEAPSRIRAEPGRWIARMHRGLAPLATVIFLLLHSCPGRAHTCFTLRYQSRPKKVAEPTPGLEPLTSRLRNLQANPLGKVSLGRRQACTRSVSRLETGKSHKAHTRRSAAYGKLQIFHPASRQACAQTHRTWTGTLASDDLRVVAPSLRLSALDYPAPGVSTDSWFPNSSHTRCRYVVNV